MDTLLRDTLEFLPALLAGAGQSGEITLVTLALALVLGLGLAMARMSHNPALHWPSYCFIEFIRNTPAVLQIYYVFFVFPSAGVTLPRFWAGVLALGINFSAYLAEVFRGGIESIGTGQWDAARALGMSTMTAMRRIILPQAFRKILPPVANYALSLFKVTSLLSLITIPELTWQGNYLASVTFKYTHIFTLVLLMYFVMVYPFSLLINVLERKTRLP